MSSRVPSILAAAAVTLLLNACSEQVTSPEVVENLPAAARQHSPHLNTALPALDYDVVDMTPGYHGFATDVLYVLESGAVVLTIDGEPHWYVDGQLIPFPTIPGAVRILVRGVIPDGSLRVIADVRIENPGGGFPSPRPTIIGRSDYQFLATLGNALDANAHGVILGINRDLDPTRIGYWDADGFTAIEFPEFGNAVSASAINDRGQVLMRRGDQVGLYDIHSGSFAQAPPLADGYYTYPGGRYGYPLNERGQVALMPNTEAEGNQGALIFDGTSTIEIPPIDPRYANRALKINDNGTVSIDAFVPESGDNLKGVYREGRTVQLPLVSMRSALTPTLDLNNRDWLVGYRSQAGTTGFAWLYRSEARGLERLPWDQGSASARALNDHGIIGGTAAAASGVHAVIWSPVGPDRLAEKMIAYLETLAASGEVPAGPARALVRTLGNGAYGGFEHQLAAFSRTGKIPPDHVHVLENAFEVLTGAHQAGMSPESEQVGPRRERPAP